MNTYNYNEFQELADAFEQVVAAAVLLREARRDAGITKGDQPISVVIARRFMQKALDDYTTSVETIKSKRQRVSV